METPTTGAQEHSSKVAQQTRPSALDALLSIVRKLSVSAQVIAGVTLFIMMLVTLGDVILRAFGRPILGAFEIISFCGGIVIGMSIPYTSWMKGHIYVDVLIGRNPRRKGAPVKIADVVNVITRCVGIALFFFIGWSFFGYGSSLQETKEVTMTLRLPYYPIAYGLGVSCFIQSILLCCDILKIVGGENE